jgi:hypothetical protein
MSNIETGQPEWIDVAKKLSPGTDAGWSEILDEALFMALEKSPELVLEA